MKFSLLLLLIAFKILNAEASEYFATTLHSKLLVRGELCESPVTVTDYVCTPGEYLLQIGDELQEPIIGRLEKSVVNTNDEFDYYKIIPTMPIDAKQRWVLRSHQLKVSLSGESTIVKVR